MARRMASGSVGHAAMMRAKSGSIVSDSAERAPLFAPPDLRDARGFRCSFESCWGHFCYPLMFMRSVERRSEHGKSRSESSSPDMM
jgi:hypothetical protein